MLDFVATLDSTLITIECQLLSTYLFKRLLLKSVCVVLLSIVREAFGLIITS